MSQMPVEKSNQAAVARSEELWNSLGQRFGLFTDLVSQRMQNAASSIREEADRIDQPQTIPVEKSSVPMAARTEASGQPVTQQAEQMVDQMGQRVSHFTATTSLEVQKATARLREEAEDMWAEAQNIRHKNGPK